jgi:hypothetical protein
LPLHWRRFFAFLAISIVACSGVDDPGPDVNRPDTFGDACGDDTTCRKPFTCLGRVCSASCASDAECPAWMATGHCAGPTQSRCVDAVCVRPLCK